MYSELTKIILLLSNNLDADSKPFSNGQVRKIIEYFYETGKSIEELSISNVRLISKLAKAVSIEESQIAHQLNYGVKLAIKIDEWQKLGIWCVSSLDLNKFPITLLSKARNKISPLLFGAGDIDLLKNPSIGIVGSRDIDMNTEAYVKKAVDKICQNNFSIISGAAKGVDITAMDHTLSNGNIVIGILASDLTKKMRDLAVINYIDENQLLFLSPEFPDSHWTVGRAMGRNKYIYLLSNAVLVGCIDKSSGGTWTGINECSKNNWNDIYVKSSGLKADLRNDLTSLNRVSLDTSLSLDKINTQIEVDFSKLRLVELSEYLGKSVTATKSYLSKSNKNCLDYSKPTKRVNSNEDNSEQKTLF